MPEARTVTLEGAREWFRKEAEPALAPARDKAEDMLGNMDKVLSKLLEASQSLLEKSGKEIDKKNMKTYRRARALNKIARLFVERVQKLRVPKSISYENYSEFVQDAGNAFAAIEVDVRNWFPRISPFFIIDRRRFLSVFEKAKASFEELKEFLRNEYSKVKLAERTLMLIDEVSDLGRQLIDLKNGVKERQRRTSMVKNELAETQKRISDLRNEEELVQMSETTEELRRLEKEFLHAIRHLRKPFLKFQSKIVRKGGLTPDELSKLTEYTDSPFEAFSSEKSGYPMLKQILVKLSSHLSERKLKLKQDRKRKAEQAIRRILGEESLSDIHTQCQRKMLQKKQLATSAETTQTRKGISRLEVRIRELRRKERRTENEAAAEQKHLEDTLKKRSTEVSEIEKNIADVTGTDVRIELQVQ